MGASSKDINLIVISGGRKAYYSSVKGCGVLIWDLRFGLFHEISPDPNTVLDFALDSENWGHCLEPRDEPLAKPVYGSVTVDFDLKRVTDDNGYGPSNRIFAEWLYAAILEVISGEPGDLIASESMRAHLEAGTVRLTPSHDRDQVPALSLPRDLVEAAEFVKARQYDYFAQLVLPHGWSIHNKGASHG